MRCLIMFSCVVFLSFVWAIPAVHGEDSPACSNQILAGSYGYSFSGFSGPFSTITLFFGAGDDKEGRVGAVGLVTFDSMGGLTARDTLSRSGTPAIGHAGTGGTYSVNANCTGHVSIDLASDPDPNGKIDSEHLEFDFMIVPGTHGREFSFIVTNQAITNMALCTMVGDCAPKPTLPEQTGVALTVGDEACSDASLQGTYRLLSTGTNLVNPLKPISNANVGFRVFDGAGQMTDGEDTGVANGVVQGTAGRTGSYSVESDCTVTLLRNDGATFSGVIVDRGRQVFFLRTGNLAITNIFLKKQTGRDVGDADTTD